MQRGTQIEEIQNSAAYKAKEQEVKKQIKKLNGTALNLADRLDLAYEIHQLCLRLLAFVEKSTKKPDAKAVVKFNNHVLYFLESVLNVKTKKEIDELMADREEKRVLNREYIPGKHNIVFPSKLPDPMQADNPAENFMTRRARYNWRNVTQQALMLSRKQAVAVNEKDLRKDQENNIKMYNDTERDVYRVIIRDGLVLQRNAQNMLNPFDTKKMSSHLKNGWAAFTYNMNGECDIFQHNNKADAVAHSTMNDSHALLFAGEIRINNGKITAITDHSGHYVPKLQNIYEILKQLKHEGVDLTPIAVHSFSQVEGLNEVPDKRKRALQFHRSKYFYPAQELLSHLENLESSENNRSAIAKARNVKLDALFTTMIDKLHELHPAITMQSLNQATSPLAARVIVDLHRRDGHVDKYLLYADRTNASLSLCFYNDAGEYKTLPFNANQIKELSEAIDLVISTKERTENLPKHYERQILAILHAKGFSVTEGQYHMNRMQAVNHLAAHPDDAIIRATSTPGNQFYVCYMKDGKFTQTVVKYSVDPTFNSVTINNEYIKKLRSVMPRQTTHWQTIAEPSLAATASHTKATLFSPRGTAAKTTNSPQETPDINSGSPRNKG